MLIEILVVFIVGNEHSFQNVRSGKRYTPSLPLKTESQKGLFLKLKRSVLKFGLFRINSSYHFKINLSMRNFTKKHDFILYIISSF